MKKAKIVKNKSMIDPKDSLVLPPFSPYLYCIPPLILSLLATVFYRPSLHYNFQFDDLANITKLYSIRNTTLRDHFFNGTRWISYWLNTIHYQIGKFDPYSYRLFNVTTHCVTSILVFFLISFALKNLKKRSFFSQNSFTIAFMTSLIFLLHPVQTQTVSYVIQGQLEGLAGFFIISISLCFSYLTQARSFLAQSTLMGLLLVLAAFSCGTKEIAIMSPLLLVIFDWFFIAQGNFESLKKRWMIHGAYFTVVFSLYLYFLKPAFFLNLLQLNLEARNNIGNVLTQDPREKILPFAFFISQFKVILHYLYMFIWPFIISVEYDWKLSTGFFAPDCFFPFIGLCILAYGVYKLLRNDSAHIGAFGPLWFMISIAPRSSFIPSSELLTDYKTYTSSFGICFMLAIALIKIVEMIFRYCSFEAIKKYPHYATNICIVLLALPLGYTTYERNKVWRSSEEFWLSIIHNAPGKARAYNNYAVALSEKGLYKESIPYYQKAIDMDAVYPDPLNNIAVAYSFMGDVDRAIDSLRRSIQIQPHYPEAYNNLASFLINKKEFDQAEQALNYALRLRPYYGKAYFNLGKIHLSKDNQEKAFECFKNACTIADLDNEAGFQLYAHMANKLRRYDDLIFAYSKLFEIQPTKEHLFNLAHACFLGEKIEQSIQTYQKLLRTYPDEKNAWYNLGEAYLKSEKPQLALNAFNKAQELHHQIPNLLLRIAYCHKLLNNLPQAEKILQDVVQLASIPEQFKMIARNELNFMYMNKKSSEATA